MGRLGLTSLGHGAFIGIGTYGTVLFWNFSGLTPWLSVRVHRGSLHQVICWW
jgi:branched-chain amino acid transport system permease protein